MSEDRSKVVVLNETYKTGAIMPTYHVDLKLKETFYCYSKIDFYQVIFNRAFNTSKHFKELIFERLSYLLLLCISNGSTAIINSL